jgi:Ca2+-binding RTX toxin-like protein
MSTVYETLYGTDNDDELTSHVVLQGDDYVYYATVHGGDGNDFITGTAQDPSTEFALFGDGGNDELSYQYFDAKVTFSGGDGDDSISIRGTQQKADGGDGYDKLYTGEDGSATLNADNVKNIEELDLVGYTYVEDFDLHYFQKIKVAGYSASLYFSHAVDLDDYPIDTDGKELTLAGSAENDRFDFSSYSSGFIVFGGRGADTIIAGAHSIYGDGGDGNDYVAGGAGDDELSGGEYQNKTAHDTVLGLGGDDKIVFNAGSGLLDGGEGDDTLFLRRQHYETISLANLEISNIETIQFDSNQIVLGSVDLSDVRKFKGDGELIASGQAIFDDITILAGSSVTIQGTENEDQASFAASKGALYFYGKGGNDEIRSNGGHAYLWGGDGDDILYGGGGGSGHLDGGDGNDVITGGDKRDQLVSGAGSDEIAAGDGNDGIILTILSQDDVKTVKAGSGNDDIKVQAKAAVSGHGLIDGGDGDDVLYASGNLTGHSVQNIETLQLRGKLTASADTFDSFNTILAKPSVWSSDVKYELLLSSGGAFTWHDGSKASYGLLEGSNQRDILDFSAAKNYWNITGGGGADTIIGTRFSDGLHGGAGNDVIEEGAGRGFIDGGVGNDAIYGSSGQDRLMGGDGLDLLDGGVGPDNIDGGEGGDTLIGGGGSDLFQDYSGKNTFIFGMNSGRDLIWGFEVDAHKHDVIDLAEINSIKNFTDLTENHVKPNEMWNGITIDLGDKNSVMLADISIEDLREEMFLF